MERLNGEIRFVTREFLEPAPSGGHGHGPGLDGFSAFHVERSVADDEDFRAF